MPPQIPMKSRKTLRLHHNIIFGLEGNDTHYLGQGWADAGPNCRWTTGKVSNIRLINPDCSDLLLEIATNPQMLELPSITHHIEVMANGALAGKMLIREGSRVALHIPTDRVPPGEILTLTFVHVDAKLSTGFGSGNEPPGIGFSSLKIFTVPVFKGECNIGAGGITLNTFMYRTGIAAEKGLRLFEAIGGSAELGNVQVQVGVKVPASLLSARINPPDLLRAFDADFGGLGEPGSFEVMLFSQSLAEYLVLDRTYGAEFRGALSSDEIVLADFMLQQRTRLREMRQKLMQVLTEGGRIFVLVPGPTQPLLTEQEILPLAIALNRHSPNWLLWVTEAVAGRPAGTVEHIAPFLLRGNIDRLQLHTHSDEPSIAVWLELCANALAITQPPVLAAHLSDQSSQHAAVEVISPSQVVGTQMENLITRRTAPLLKEVGQAQVPEAHGEQAFELSEPEYSVLQRLTFGEDGNELAALGFGWGGGDDGYRWSTESICELWLNHPGQKNVILTIEGWPFVSPPILDRQRVELDAHDERLTTLTFESPARMGVFIPATALRKGRILRLRCTLPDAMRPCDVSESEDDRQLGLAVNRVAVHSLSGRMNGCSIGMSGISPAAVKARMGMELGELFNCFEALGASQAFLEVRFRVGETTPSLFNRANIGLLNLVRAIDNHFAGFADSVNLRSSIYSRKPESYEMLEMTTGFNYVVEHDSTDSTNTLLITRESERLRVLRDKLLCELASGEKMFVYHQTGNEEVLSETNMLPLLIALREHGPSSLLFVTLDNDTYPPGTVRQIFPGLLHGYLSRSEIGIDSTTLSSWTELLFNAKQLVSSF